MKSRSRSIHINFDHDPSLNNTTNSENDYFGIRTYLAFDSKGQVPEKKDQKRSLSTVWKFHNFSITQILREINFGDSRSAKSAVFVILESEFSSFGQFQPSKNAKIHKDSKFRTSKFAKMAHFALLESPKLISRKI